MANKCIVVISSDREDWELLKPDSGCGDWRAWCIAKTAEPGAQLGRANLVFCKSADAFAKVLNELLNGDARDIFLAFHLGEKTAPLENKNIWRVDFSHSGVDPVWRHWEVLVRKIAAKDAEVDTALDRAYEALLIELSDIERRLRAEGQLFLESAWNLLSQWEDVTKRLTERRDEFSAVVDRIIPESASLVWEANKQKIREWLANVTNEVAKTVDASEMPTGFRVKSVSEVIALRDILFGSNGAKDQTNQGLVRLVGAAKNAGSSG